MTSYESWKVLIFPKLSWNIDTSGNGYFITVTQFPFFLIYPEISWYILFKETVKSSHGHFFHQVSEFLKCLKIKKFQDISRQILKSFSWNVLKWKKQKKPKKKPLDMSWNVLKCLENAGNIRNCTKYFTSVGNDTNDINYDIFGGKEVLYLLQKRSAVELTTGFVPIKEMIYH